MSDLTMPALRSTIGNATWMAANQAQLLESIPPDWRTPEDLMLPLGFKLKLLGCNWRSEADIIACLYWLTHLQLLETRPNPGASGRRALVVRRREVASA